MTLPTEGPSGVKGGFQQSGKDGEGGIVRKFLECWRNSGMPLNLGMGRKDSGRVPWIAGRSNLVHFRQETRSQYSLKTDAEGTDILCSHLLENPESLKDPDAEQDLAVGV